jgi:hypothetical protein
MKPDDTVEMENELVWSEEQISSELEKAKRIGVRNLSNGDLLRLCRSLRGRFLTHFWADARPFFVELWRRIENKQIADIPTKTEACRLLGISMRWAEKIVEGKAKKKGAPDSAGLNFCAPHPQLFTNEEFVVDIGGYANRQLQALARENRKRYDDVCTAIADHFGRLRRIERR